MTVSRSLSDLHEYLANAFVKAQAEFKTLYPELPQPFITCTFRSRQEQDRLYAQGRTKPGMKVTNARAGQSVHNYLPSFAFDIAFKRGNALDWDIDLFKKFAAIIAKDKNVEWGGSWKSFPDAPHFQFKNFTWKQAQAGEQPKIK